MIVVQAPDSVTAGRLQHVLHLYFSHQVYVFVKDQTDQLLQLVVLAEAQSEEGPAEIHKRHLMTRAVVYSDA